MKERPILFSAPMVRALLNCTKSQTRRVVKGNPARVQWNSIVVDSYGGWCDEHGRPVPCPYGEPGDRLWVRETHFINDFRGAKVPEAERADCEILYRATDEKMIANFEDDEGLVWKPSIHMPRWASRILLEITDIRVERLQDISESDGIAEGIYSENVIVGANCNGGMHSEEHADRYFFCGCVDEGYESACDAYAALWESINGTGSWAANPWVWVVEFKRIEAKVFGGESDE